jgi:hypothetical protein
MQENLGAIALLLSTAIAIQADKLLIPILAH